MISEGVCACVCERGRERGRDGEMDHIIGLHTVCTVCVCVVQR